MAMQNGQALLALLESERCPVALAAALHEVRTLLEPLLELGAGGHPRVEALRAAARTHGPLVTRLVKALSGRLAPESRNGQLDAILGEAACLGLDALDCLRPVIKASQHDLAAQRYGFLRKMAALGLYEHALAQGKVLHASVVALGVGGLAGPDDLHVAAVANLLLCYCELVQPDAGRAPTLWAEVSGPLDGILSVARDAVDGSNLSKQLDPVLKCLSKVVEQLKQAAVTGGLSPASIAQQLTAFVTCGALCKQDQVVKQVLMSDAGVATEAVQHGLTEALLWHLTEQGKWQDVFRCCKLSAEHAGATAVRVALQLPHAVLSKRPAEQLPAVLGALSLSAKAMAHADGTPEPAQCWIRWCCLDILRGSVSAVLAQLVNTPQSAGGQLLALVQCMELLAHDSTCLLGRRDSPSASLVPAGCSAAAIAIRLLVAHRICTGQLAELHADVSRTVQLLRRVVEQHQLQGCPGGKEAVGASVLQSLSASLGNAGLDLLQAQHTAPAAELLQVAAELALARAQQLAEDAAAPAGVDVAQLVKKCKAHVTALEQLSEHVVGMAAAASYIAQLHEVCGGVSCFVSRCWNTAATTPRAASSGPAAPCKAPRRGGRLQRMQADAQPQETQAANARIQLADGHPAEAATFTGVQLPQLRPQSAAVATVGGAPLPARCLVQDLAAAVQPGGAAASGLLECLDAYAVQEVEVVAEECKRRGEGDAFTRAHTAAVLDALTRCANANGAAVSMRARALLVKALVGGAGLSEQVDSLQAACDLLDRQLEGEAAPASGLLDSAALAHAQLGVCLAQCQLAQLPHNASREPMFHIARAVTFWEGLLRAVADDGAGPTLRMPHATLHAALQAQQLLQLRACGHPKLVADSGPVFWRLARAVKLREQHVYLLCVTMPASTCLGWALAPQPWPCLAEAASRQPQGKVEAVLQLTQPLRFSSPSALTNVTNACRRDASVGGLLDHRALAAAADACAAELERSGFLRHGPAPLLLRSQCHQLAAAAHLRAGDTASAHMQAQEALRITCGLFSLLECSPPAAGRSDSGATSASSPQQEQTPAESAAAAVQSGAATSAQDYAEEEDAEDQGELAGAKPPRLGLAAAVLPAGAPAAEPAPSRGVSAAFGWTVSASHLASLHQAARAFEAGGCPEDAACLWNECCRTAEAFGATGVRAMSCCHLAELCCRQGNAEAAEAHLAAAAAAAGEGAAEVAGGCDAQLLRALLCSARARRALLGSQCGAAEEACGQGTIACDAASAQLTGPGLEAAAAAGTASCGGAAPAAALWLAASQRSQLVRLSAESVLRRGHASQAAALLHAALGELQRAAALHGPALCAEAVWPVDCGLLLAHEAAAAVIAARAGSPGGRAAHAGQGSGGAAHIVGLGRGGGAVCWPGADAAIERMLPLDGEADGDLLADQPNKRGGKPGSKSGTGKPIRDAVRRQAGQDPAAAPAPPASSTAGLAPLLLSLRLCWQLPLAAAHACQQLLRASMALGLPHAAAMFLHLGQGMSYAQQQALHLRLRQRSMRAVPSQTAARASKGVAANSSSSSQASGSESAGVDAESAAAEPGARWDAREAALQAMCSLCEGVRAGGGSQAAAAAALEGAAAAWLGQAMSVLPAGCVLVAIAQDAGDLLLSRLSAGSSPLLVCLPGPLPDTDCDTGKACDGRSGPSASQALDGCVAQLRGLLEESGDSMRVDQDGALSQTRKAEWWKMRTSLDERVRQLLLAMDQQCLGPWRCLLLPVPDRERRALAAAAQAFAREHFPALAHQPQEASGPRLAASEEEEGGNRNSGGSLDSSSSSISSGSLGLLTELLVLVLANVAQLPAADVQVLLGAACGMAGGAPTEAARLADLAAQLVAAEAAARMQRLCLPRGGQCGGAAGGSGAAVGGQVQVEAEAGSSASRKARGAAAAAGSAGAGVTAGASARVRPAVGRAAVAVAAAVAAEPEGPLEAQGRGRRAPRLAAMQQEASRLAGATAIAAGSSTRPFPTAAAAPGTVTTAAACGTSREDSPVLLALGAALHALPWESTPCLRGQQVYRILSLPLACSAAASAAAAPPVSSGVADGCTAEASGAKVAVGATAARGGPRARNAAPPPHCAASSSSSAPPTTSTSAPGGPAGPSAFYLLNPSGDLADTQRFFQPLLEAQPGWQGLVGERPAARALLSALQSHDLFLYFGHGSGEQLLPLPALRKLQRCAAAVLMGCSSGRLRAHGAYDPAGAAAAYMVAGCPALVANLWDVTDRDIDRYCQALMHSWLGCWQPPRAPDAAPAATGRATAAGVKGRDAQEASPQGARMQVEGDGGDGDSSGGCAGAELALAGAVARSRAACKLPYLIGAAPVCYGLPVGLWRRAGWSQ
ncbi:Separin [Tetrabaena socialis]|uniref:separase n=1 Tax=Tetrabaena socialis TaxID=47790 RepID=A0A2J8AD68_9CHLO|nr:Separin [Tetrabaena socialis]|eukprot:PNH10462.1 Separin [Tetrabaena socialis]